MMKLLRHTRFWQGLGLLVADGIFFTLTNSSRVVSSLLMLGFLLLVISLYYLYSWLLAAAQLYGLPFSSHRRRLTLFVTGVSACLLALQSIGELSARDGLVLLPLAVVLYIYLGYGRAKFDQ